MSMSKSMSGAALATAAALLFSTAPISTSVAAEAKMHCMGVNACKGQPACKTASNACAGQNSCKGTGFLEMTKSQCEQATAKKG